MLTTKPVPEPTDPSVGSGTGVGARRPSTLGARFAAARRAVIDSADLGAAGRRRALTDLTDRWLSELFQRAVDETPHVAAEQVALVATGGYGRRELLPGSDLDVLLLHDGLPATTVATLADGMFYPVWDSKVPLDHAVRTVAGARAVARDDLKATLGLLDVRHVAGAAGLTTAVHQQVLADWRSDAHRRLPLLHGMVLERAERCGELPYLLEPDLVEAYGGLRDGVVLRAVAASWVADQPHSATVDEARRWLLTVRDALHRTTGRRSDRLHLQEQADVAGLLGLSDGDALLRRVSEAGRATTFAADVTWRAVDRALEQRRRRFRRRQQPRRPLADGVVLQDGQAVLARDADPAHDPTLLVRSAAAAAQAGVPLAPASLDRLVTASGPLPTPWPASARDAFVALLGAGRAALPVLDALEVHGVLVRWIPEWETIRFRPQHTPIHRHTVDRHSLQAAVEASALTRRVARPDVLLVAALLHDIGKGSPGDHSVVGAPMAARIAERLGFDPADAATIALLVACHLLLPEYATGRDLDDPSTVDQVIAALAGPGPVDRDVALQRLELLATLTEADAVAAGPLAWTSWRAGLVRDLVGRVRRVLAGHPRAAPTHRADDWARTLAGLGQTDLVLAAPDLDGIARITVVAPDRLGLLATVAGVLSLHRLEVRGASIETIERTAVQLWRVGSPYGDFPAEHVLRRDLLAALDERLDVTERLRRRAAARTRPTGSFPPPTVRLLPGASQTATVLEVRSHDEAGLLHRIAAAVAATGSAVRSAAVDTLGADAVDVLYLVDATGRPLSQDVADRVVTAVELAMGHGSGAGGGTEGGAGGPPAAGDAAADPAGDPGSTPAPVP